MRIDVKEIDYVILNRGDNNLNTNLTLYLYLGFILIASSRSLIDIKGMKKVCDVIMDVDDIIKGIYHKSITLEEMLEEVPRRLDEYNKELENLKL